MVETPPTPLLIPTGMGSGPTAPPRKTSATAPLTNLRTSPSCRNRTSLLAGCTFTSTPAGSISRKRTATGKRPRINALWYPSNKAAFKLMLWMGRPFTKRICSALVARLTPGRPIYPFSLIPPSSTSKGRTEDFHSFPKTAVSLSSSPDRALSCQKTAPSRLRTQLTSGRAKAVRRIPCSICPHSVSSVRRNFLRPGTWAKSCFTSILVPFGQPVWPARMIFPPSITTSVPSNESASFVFSVNRLTEAMLGSASPRKPNVRIPNRSAASRILLVACRSKANSASSGPIPWPSSVTRIRDRPPRSTLTSTFLAPASREFSTNSFTTDAGRSTTSPAAIRFATTSASRRIR